MRLKIIQHVFSSFIHRIYICPTWVNITWEKCYFQKGVFFFFDASASEKHRNRSKLKWWDISPVKHSDVVKHDNRTMAACEGG